MKKEDFLKKCKKDIDKITKICKAAPSIDDVTKELKVFSQYTDLLDVEKINKEITTTDLQFEYKKCTKLKEKAERSLVRIKKMQLEMKTSIEGVEAFSEKLKQYLMDIERMSSDVDISTIKIMINQTLLSNKKWIEEENKLIESLKIGVDTGVKLFKDYISKIVSIQKERLL